MTIRVKNLKGTSELSCKCGTWLRHWERRTGRDAAICLVVPCKQQSDLVGAHVIKVGSKDKNRYIVPMCQAHNMSEQDLRVDDKALAPANKQSTCE